MAKSMNPNPRANGPETLMAFTDKETGATTLHRDMSQVNAGKKADPHELAQTIQQTGKIEAASYDGNSAKLLNERLANIPANSLNVNGRDYDVRRVTAEVSDKGLKGIQAAGDKAPTANEVGKQGMMETQSAAYQATRAAIEADQRAKGKDEKAAKAISEKGAAQVLETRLESALKEGNAYSADTRKGTVQIADVTNKDGKTLASFDAVRDVQTLDKKAPEKQAEAPAPAKESGEKESKKLEKIEEKGVQALVFHDKESGSVSIQSDLSQVAMKKDAVAEAAKDDAKLRLQEHAGPKGNAFVENNLKDAQAQSVSINGRNFDVYRIQADMTTTPAHEGRDGKHRAAYTQVHTQGDGFKTMDPPSVQELKAHTVVAEAKAVAAREAYGKEGAATLDETLKGGPAKLASASTKNATVDNPEFNAVSQNTQKKADRFNKAAELNAPAADGPEAQNNGPKAPGE